MRKYLAIAAAVALSTSSAQAAELIVNGGFEAPVIGANNFSNYVAPGTLNGESGWTVVTGDVDIVRNLFGGGSAFEGEQFLDLWGYNPGVIAQSFATVIGAQYNLTFAYSHNSFGGLASASALFAAGDLVGSVTHATGNGSNLDWQIFTGGFTATDTTTTLTFVNTDGGNNAGILLDGISVAAVPEPATWGMMILGVGVIGTIMRRRRTVRVSFA